MRSWRHWRGQHGEQMAVSFCKVRATVSNSRTTAVERAKSILLRGMDRRWSSSRSKPKGQTIFGAPQAMVDARKQKKIVHVAMVYVQQHQFQDVDVRFDVVAITSSLVCLLK